VSATADPTTDTRPDSASTDILLSVRGLEVHFPIKSGVVFERQIGAVKAVDGVDLDVPRGWTVGLVGESGCGKTTLGRAVLRLVEPTGGAVSFDGIDVHTLEGEDLRRMRRRMQMIFQDPMASLDPRQSIESVLTEPRRAHGIDEGGTRSVSELLDLVGLPASAAWRYPHEFSGGQRQRIAIARALALSPRLVVLDEPVSALDVSIRAQILNLLRDLQTRLGVAYLFIAHDLAAVAHMSHTIAVMYLGQIVEWGEATEVALSPKHPYTQALFAAALPIDIDEAREGIALSGEVPSPLTPPSGCRFHPRCPHAMDRCATEEPPLRPADGRPVACHLYDDRSS
jgi:peptide/nickel transport system ATP-binding protein